MHLDKWELIEKLEGRLLRNPAGWAFVSGGRLHTRYGSFSLAVNYSEPELELMYRRSKTISVRNKRPGWAIRPARAL